MNSNIIYPLHLPELFKKLYKEGRKYNALALYWGRGMSDTILEIENLSKRYPGINALNSVSFKIKRGTVHCIVGENGAGKSTLIKIITGAIMRTEGKIYYNGNEYEARNTHDAIQCGISTIFQELNVVDQLTVSQNLNLGIEKSKYGFEIKYSSAKKAEEMINTIDRRIKMNKKVAFLSFAQKQIMEIVKALISGANIIIMDEPTAAITEDEIEKLYGIIRELVRNQVTIIYISHRLDEIFDIGDYVTILRDGEHIETKPVNEIKDKSELINMMIGKTVKEKYISGTANYCKKVLEVFNINDDKLKNITFDLHEGEIIGFYGLVGSGKTEISLSLYGARKTNSKIKINNKEIQIKNPSIALKNGISLVPEERRAQGIFSELSIAQNISSMDLKTVSKIGIIDGKKEVAVGNKFIKILKIATSHIGKKIAMLSGGNQQKVVISKCLNADSKIILLDEPTRGIDVGGKHEIHQLIRKLTTEGVSVVLFSSELPEVMSMCDRIFILFDGELKGVFVNDSEQEFRDEMLHLVLRGEL